MVQQQQCQPEGEPKEASHRQLTRVAPIIRMSFNRIFRILVISNVIEFKNENKNVECDFELKDQLCKPLIILSPCVTTMNIHLLFNVEPIAIDVTDIAYGIDAITNQFVIIFEFTSGDMIDQKYCKCDTKLEDEFTQ